MKKMAKGKGSPAWVVPRPLSTLWTRVADVLELKEDVSLSPNMFLKDDPAKIVEAASIGELVENEEAVQSVEAALIGEKAKRE